MSCTCPRWPRTRRWSSTSWTKEWRSTSGATETSSVRKIRSTQGTTRSTTKSWTCARNQTTRGKNKSWHLYHFSLSPDFGKRKGKKKMFKCVVINDPHRNRIIRSAYHALRGSLSNRRWIISKWNVKWTAIEARAINLSFSRLYVTCA